MTVPQSTIHTDTADCQAAWHTCEAVSKASQGGKLAVAAPGTRLQRLVHAVSCEVRGGGGGRKRANRTEPAKVTTKVDQAKPSNSATSSPDSLLSIAARRNVVLGGVERVAVDGERIYRPRVVQQG